MWHSGSSHVESTVDIRLDSSIELIVGNVGNVRNGVHDTCIIDQNVNLAPRLDDGLNDSFTARLVPDVLGI